MALCKIQPKRAINRLYWIFAWLFSLALIASAASSADPAKPVKIGVILGLSGSMAPAVHEMCRGIELALAERDTWPMQLIFEDDQGMEQKAAVTALTKLLTVDKVTAVLNWVNTTMLSLAPLANRYKVPIIEFWDHNRGMLKLGPYVFCSGTSTELSGMRIARFMARARHIKRAAVITLHDPWSELISGVFRDVFTEEGGAIVYEARVDPDEKDLKTELLRAKKAGAEAVFAPVFLGSLYALVRQGRDLGYGDKIYTADGFFESDLAALGAAAEGVYSSQTIILDPNFQTKYAERYHTRPSAIGLGYAGLAYDGIKILSAAFKAVAAEGKELTPEAVRDALTPMRYSGVSGVAVLSGEAEKVEDIVVVKKGRFEAVGWRE